MPGGGRLWRCPECGHRFVTRNLWHSCGRFRISDHFKGKPAIVRAAYRRWVQTARDSENFGRLGYGHHFRISGADDVDAELASLMLEAYSTAVAGNEVTPARG